MTEQAILHHSQILDGVKRWLWILPVPIEVQWPSTLIIRLSRAPWHPDPVPGHLLRGGPNWDERVARADISTSDRAVFVGYGECAIFDS